MKVDIDYVEGKYRIATDNVWFPSLYTQTKVRLRLNEMSNVNTRQDCRPGFVKLI